MAISINIVDVNNIGNLFGYHFHYACVCYINIIIFQTSSEMYNLHVEEVPSTLTKGENQ